MVTWYHIPCRWHHCHTAHLHLSGCTESSTYVPRNLGIRAISRLHCTCILRIQKLCTNLDIRFMQPRNCTAPVCNLEIVQFCCMTIEPRLLFEFPLCIKVRNIRKELLQLRHHHQCWACTQAPYTRDFWEVCQLGETHFPSAWVRVQRPQTCVKSSPTQRALARSQLSSVSQLSHSHLLSPLH